MDDRETHHNCTTVDVTTVAVWPASEYHSQISIKSCSGEYRPFRVIAVCLKVKELPLISHERSNINCSAISICSGGVAGFCVSITRPRGRDQHWLTSQCTSARLCANVFILRWRVVLCIVVILLFMQLKASHWSTKPDLLSSSQYFFPAVVSLFIQSCIWVFTTGYTNKQ